MSVIFRYLDSYEFVNKKGLNKTFFSSTAAWALRLRSGCIGALASMEHFQLQHGRWFPDNISKEFQRCYLIYRACLNELAVLAVQAGQLRYHLRPKCHQLGHLTFHFLPRNPRYFHVYQDEDFIARTKRVAEVRDPVFVSRLALFRYIIHVCMMWAEACWPSRGLGRGKRANLLGSNEKQIQQFWVVLAFVLRLRLM